MAFKLTVDDAKLEDQSVSEVGYLAEDPVIRATATVITPEGTVTTTVEYADLPSNYRLQQSAGRTALNQATRGVTAVLTPEPAAESAQTLYEEARSRAADLAEQSAAGKVRA